MFITFVLFALILLGKSTFVVSNLQHIGSLNLINASVRIVGGIPTSIQDFSFMFSLQRNNRHICGASLVKESISNKYLILSSAHCVTNKTGQPRNVRSLKLVAGSASLVGSTPGRITLTVRQLVMHPNYSKLNKANDIAILFLLDLTSLSKVIRPISLPTPNFEYSGNAKIVGWGKTTANGKTSLDQLQVATISIVNHEDCANRYGYYGNRRTLFMKTNICARDKFGGKDTCQGDSGGPLFVPGGTWDKPILLGITSFGRGCGHARFPGVYTKVSAFVPWIRAVIQETG